jgi:hypothetical protein
MDQGQVLLVNLAKGHIGEDSSSLLGGLLVTTIGLAALAGPTRLLPNVETFSSISMNSKASPLWHWPTCFPSSANIELASLWRISICTGLSWMSVTRSWEMPAQSFHFVGVEDARYLVREFQPKFEELDLLQLPNYRIFI